MSPSRRNLLLTLSIAVLLILASLFLFPSFRSFLSSRVLPIPPITETMVGGRLVATPAPGPHTLTYEARTSTGQTITDSVTFTQPNPSSSPTPQCNNNGILDAGEACDTGPTTLKDYCSNRCQVELDVTEYGATPNDPSDPRTFAESDTLNIQNAFNSANGRVPVTNQIPPGAAPVKTPLTFNPPDTLVTTVYFPAGRYDVTQVHPWWGTTITGDGPSTVIKRLPNRPKAERMFNTTRLLETGDSGYLYWAYNNSVDSQELTIKNITFDGNGLNQQPLFVGFGPGSTEWQDILFLGASDTSPGRLKVVIKDVDFREAGSAAIWNYVNTDITIQDSTCHNAYLCMQNSRGNSKILVERMNITFDPGWAGNTNMNAAFDNEITSSGYGGSMRQDTILRDITTTAPFQFHNYRDGSLVADNLQQTAPGGLHSIGDGTATGTVTINNSSLAIGNPEALGNGVNYLYRPKNITFNNTTFTAVGNRPLPLSIWWNADGSQYKNQKVTCNNCTFAIAEGVTPIITPIAIQTSYDYKSWNNVLKINGGSISSDFKEGLKMVQGGTWDITGMDIQSSNIPSVVPDIHVRSSGTAPDVNGEHAWYNVQLHQITPSDVVIWQYEPTDPNNIYVKD